MCTCTQKILRRIFTYRHAFYRFLLSIVLDRLSFFTANERVDPGDFLGKSDADVFNTSASHTLTHIAGGRGIR